MILRKQLKVIMQSHRYTASQLARVSGVPNSTIAGWLAGRYPKNVDQLYAVSRILSVSLEELLFGEAPIRKARAAS